MGRYFNFSNDYIKFFFLNDSKFNLITVTNDFNKALEKLKYNNIMNNFIGILNKDKQNTFFNSTIFNRNKKEIFRLKFSYEK